MRRRVMGELHREFGHVKLLEVTADVVVLAGDSKELQCASPRITWPRRRAVLEPVPPTQTGTMLGCVIDSDN